MHVRSPVGVVWILYGIALGRSIQLVRSITPYQVAALSPVRC